MTDLRGTKYENSKQKINHLRYGWNNLKYIIRFTSIS